MLLTLNRNEDTFGNTFDLAHFDCMHSMAGIVGWKDILQKTLRHNIIKRVFRLHYSTDFQIGKGSKKREAVLKIVMTPTLFGFKLTKLNISMTMVCYLPVLYGWATVPIVGIKMLVVIAYTSLSPLHWENKFRFYYHGTSLLSFLMTKFSPKTAKANV